MKKIIFIFQVIALIGLKQGFCYNNVIKGDIATTIDGNDTVVVRVTSVSDSIQYIKVKTFFYPTYGTGNPITQQIENFSFSYIPAITQTTNATDADGNSCRYSYWGNPSIYKAQVFIGDYKITNTFTAYQYVILDGLRDSTRYPIAVTFPIGVQRYLQPTSKIQSDNSEIKSFAQNLVSGCRWETQAVSKIMDWARDNMKWEVGHPNDALWILRDSQHRAICSGFAHLPIALLRSIGIPARYVSAINLPDTFWIPTVNNGWIKAVSGRGTHAWFEVYYSNAGWIPYDAQGFYHFVNTFRYVQSKGLDEDSCVERIMECGFWGLSIPTFELKSNSNSTVSFHDQYLQFVDTLPTPAKLSISDKLYPIEKVDDEIAQMPSSFCLKQNFPNPFNSETIIEYTLPEGPKMVNLTIYNILGQKVKTLVNEEREAGIYRIHWYGRNEQDEEVSSGIYFYRIKISDYTDVKRIAFIK